MRRAALLLPLVALAGCGSTTGDEAGYTCSGRTCVLTYEEPGTRDLTAELGAGATFALRSVGDGQVEATIAGKPVTLVLNKRVQVEDFSVLLRTAEPKRVSIRVVGS